MDFDDETLDTDSEIGSDELLSDDNLRLPEAASILVRVHAVRAWLARRREETTREVGEAALALQEAMQQPVPETRLRRRERQQQQEQTDHAQRLLSMAQLRLHTYEEAQALLEECITHTSGERVLVEYYLALEGLVQNIIATDTSHILHDFDQRPRLQALADVQHRVERIGAPGEDD
ncbi:MAG: hypothetical protein ACR2H5_10585 [Ktedonobacteraceae bacterium]